MQHTGRSTYDNESNYPYTHGEPFADISAIIQAAIKIQRVVSNHPLFF